MKISESIITEDVTVRKTKQKKTVFLVILYLLTNLINL